MNKEEILKRSRHDNNKEFTDFLAYKTTPLLIILFLMICISMIVFSFFSPYKKEIIYTTCSLFFSLITFYSLAYFYYMHIKKYLYLSIISMIFIFPSLFHLWILMW